MKALFLLCLTMNAFALEITGKAYFKDQLIYTEKHDAKVDDLGFYKELKTTYLDAKNTPIAKIESQFAKNKVIPDYVFEDYRFKLKESVKLSSDQNKIIIEQNKKGKIETNELEIKSNSILSQGFHNYIVLNFDKLQKEKQDVYFVVTSKFDQYRFDVKTEKIVDGKIHISIRPSNFILDAILPPLRLVYEISSKRLLSFEGLTNIDDEKGKSQSAVIKYSYQ